MSLVFDFGQGLRNLRYDVVCTLETAAVTELWRLKLFSCTSSSFLREANVAIFCERFSWSRQTSLSKGFFYYFHDFILNDVFVLLLANVDVIPKQKQLSAV